MPLPDTGDVFTELYLHHVNREAQPQILKCVFLAILIAAVLCGLHDDTREGFFAVGQDLYGCGSRLFASSPHASTAPSLEAPPPSTQVCVLSAELLLGLVLVVVAVSLVIRLLNRIPHSQFFRRKCAALYEKHFSTAVQFAAERHIMEDIAHQIAIMDEISLQLAVMDIFLWINEHIPRLARPPSSEEIRQVVRDRKPIYYSAHAGALEGAAMILSPDEFEDILRCLIVKIMDDVALLLFVDCFLAPAYAFCLHHIAAGFWSPLTRIPFVTLTPFCITVLHKWVLYRQQPSLSVSAFNAQVLSP